MINLQKNKKIKIRMSIAMINQMKPLTRCKKKMRLKKKRRKVIKQKSIRL